MTPSFKRVVVIAAPVLVLIVVAFIHMFPGAVFTVMKAAGHLPMLEKPEASAHASTVFVGQVAK